MCYPCSKCNRCGRMIEPGTCHVCGHVNEVGAKCCSECGNPFPAPPGSPEAPSEFASRKEAAKH